MDRDSLNMDYVKIYEIGGDNFALFDNAYPFGGKGTPLSHNFDSPELFIGYKDSAKIEYGERYLINNVSEEKILIQIFSKDDKVWRFVWE